MNRHKHSDLFEHEADASYNMEVCDGRSASFVVIDESSEAGRPTEGVLGNPASWQEDEAALCFWQFDGFELLAVFAGRLRRLFARIALTLERL